MCAAPNIFSSLKLKKEKGGGGGELGFDAN